jgi:ATP-dependent protease HslVU (ClpYQ) ATPase subunit
MPSAQATKYVAIREIALLCGGRGVIGLQIARRLFKLKPRPFVQVPALP